MNFFFMNLKVIRNGKLRYDELPSCQQKTIVSGMGKVSIGIGCTFGFRNGGFHRGGSVEFQTRFSKSQIEIGDHVATNNNVFICSANKIHIGSNSLIGQNVTMMDFEAHGIEPSKRREIGIIGKIIIGNNVWIGDNVVILKNSEIGDNSIVATGAVVSGVFPENVILGGVPAKIIKQIDH